ncbi:MAG: putative Ig domain-containing protein [Gaiellaceae bacterium]
MRRGASLALFAVLAATAPEAAASPMPAHGMPAVSAAAPARPHVTVIGDSVLTQVLWNAAPLQILENGFDVWMQIGVCRRLTGQSCPFEGGEVPTLLDVVRQYGTELGPTVVVEVGYNDYQQTFAQSVEQSIDALLAAGVKHILWATLREAHQSYVSMNADLLAASRRHPEVALVDWNDYSRDHPDWFQNDGIHLYYNGGVGFATLLHTALRELLAPPPQVVVVSPPPPTAHVGRRYAARLVAAGGTAPYTWKLVGGTLPTGLQLGADGTIAGVPSRPGRTRITARAVDSQGRAVLSRTELEVTAASM